MLSALQDRTSRVSLLLVTTLVLGHLIASRCTWANPGTHENFTEFANDYCVDCHSGPDAEARFDIEALLREETMSNVRQWRKVVGALADHSMPPPDGEQPPEAQRSTHIGKLEAALQALIEAHSYDPGPTQLRRLTNAEYEYAIADLTGIQFPVAQQLLADHVGGSGFTNSASVQFLQAENLRRYLEIAKQVADHLMVGAGEPHFYSSPGQTGMELSAINRIKSIYRSYGFRSAAGEGAEPFGLKLIPKAFFVAWQHRNRSALGLPDATLAELAKQHSVPPKFARHVWSVLNRNNPSYPLSAIVNRWSRLPAPRADADFSAEDVFTQCEQLFAEVQTLQARFAGSASAEEEAALLTNGQVNVPVEADFVARAVRKRRKIDGNFTPDLENDELYSEVGTIRFRISVEPASVADASVPVVIFSQPLLQIRLRDAVEPDPVALATALPRSQRERCAFGRNPGGEPIDETQFALRSGDSLEFSVELPDQSRVGELLVHARLDRQLGHDSVVRCTISDITDGDQGRSYSSLLRDPDSQQMDHWVAGIAEFAAALPQVSHREPTPSDRDPIPAPYENTYNTPERNYFHTAIKYHRDDRFLVEHVLREEVAQQLDAAWTDLLLSFDYHALNFRFAAEKFEVESDQSPALQLEPLNATEIASPAAEYLLGYQRQYDSMRRRQAAAESMHQGYLQEFARRAFRRPLSEAESQAAKAYYAHCRNQLEMSVAEAARASIVRILTSPAFLLRAERPAAGAIAALSPYELASRLSFSIWSSIPDAELLDAAEQGRLGEPQVLREQVRRMLESPKARRLATEFFGQWLGFYQFDGYRGVDTQRFPEFDRHLRSSLHEEAVRFFEFVIRADRPYTELINADYRFLNSRLINHYGLEALGTGKDFQRVELPHRQAGGLFTLGAILTSTSAPLRTSAVKRGDWILRRILDTPVPPPPADAGSIAAEEALSDGLTIRQRLEMHRNQPACHGCHSRIDPLGFALEQFDSLGRWRDTYQDGLEINTASQLADGSQIEGLPGLLKHLHRHDGLFRRTLASRLVAYFLGRPESLQDQALIGDISQALQKSPQFSTAILTIVTSPQFSQKRPEQFDASEQVAASTTERK